MASRLVEIVMNPDHIGTLEDDSNEEFKIEIFTKSMSNLFFLLFKQNSLTKSIW